ELDDPIDAGTEQAARPRLDVRTGGTPAGEVLDFRQGEPHLFRLRGDVDPVCVSARFLTHIPILPSVGGASTKALPPNIFPCVKRLFYGSPRSHPGASGSGRFQLGCFWGISCLSYTS